jgi:hypothetical protein
VYRDDIGQCWPAGLPMIMTRVWPIAMVPEAHRVSTWWRVHEQLPDHRFSTAAHIGSARRRAQLQRRVADLARCEKDTLVVTPGTSVGHHPLDIELGCAAIDELHIVERIKPVTQRRHAGNRIYSHRPEGAGEGR